MMKRKKFLSTLFASALAVSMLAGIGAASDSCRL